MNCPCRPSSNSSTRVRGTPDKSALCLRAILAEKSGGGNAGGSKQAPENRADI